MIYLGKMADMDPNEWKSGAECAKAVLGGESFGGATNPLFKDLVQVSAHDTNHDGIIRTNDGLGQWFSEKISHDATGSDKDYRVDSTFLVKNSTVTFLNPDGTTSTECVTVRIMQDTGGNTFLMPPPANASDAEIALMTSRPIVGVSFSNSSRDYDLCHDSIFTDRSCFPCFARGTLIATEQGDLPVEQLVAGMKVMTRDHGLQELRWTGARALGATVLELNPNLRPIRVTAGALGNGLPRRDLIVSPQHRILVRSKIAQKMFGSAEVLVAAKQLLQVTGIDIASDVETVEYFHLLFDQHEVVFSEGAETESLYTGSEALKSVGHAAREEIFAIFPELRDMALDPAPQGARLLASGRQGRKLAVRHAQHHKALVQ